MNQPGPPATAGQQPFSPMSLRIVVSFFIATGTASWLPALPFPFPQPQYGCIGGQGELHLVKPLGTLDLAGWRCPVALRYRAANPIATGWLKGKWSFPLLDGYCLQKDVGTYEMMLLDGSVVTFDNRTGQMKQKGRMLDEGGRQANWALLVKSDEEILARNQDGTQLRFSGGLIVAAQLPNIGMLEWHRDETEHRVQFSGSTVLSLRREGDRLRLLVGGDERMIETEDDRLRVTDGLGTETLLARRHENGDRATLHVRESGGENRYVYESASGVLKSDGQYTYTLMRSKRMPTLTQGVMRENAEGIREGMFFDDILAAYEVFHPDGRHERRYVSFAEGPRFGKVWKLARVVEGKETLVWRKDFDALGRTSFCRDEAGAEYTYRYASMGPFPRTVTLRRADGGVSEWTYDALGRVVKRTEGADAYAYAYDGIPASLVSVKRNGGSHYEQRGAVQ